MKCLFVLLCLSRESEMNVAEDTVFVWLEEKEAEGDLIALYSFLMRGGREGGAELLSWDLDPVTGCVAVVQSWVKMGSD